MLLNLLMMIGVATVVYLIGMAALYIVHLDGAALFWLMAPFFAVLIVFSAGVMQVIRYHMPAAKQARQLIAERKVAAYAWLRRGQNSIGSR